MVDFIPEKKSRIYRSTGISHNLILVYYQHPVRLHIGQETSLKMYFTNMHGAGVAYFVYFFSPIVQASYMVFIDP